MVRSAEQIVDEILVMDAQDGKARAMEMLVSRWQKRLWQHALRLTADEQAAWDVTQQSWLGIIKGLRKLHDPASFRAWAYKITTNKSFDWIRKNKAVKQVSLDEIQDHQQKETKDTGLKELLQKLDVRKRAVICLYYFEQLTIPEVSAALKIPKGTVKSRLTNARKELKVLYKKHFE
ncbi:MAG: sigma-70 family RNA polymerase sigma factor [Phycisphaerae bacterium]|nr:sigma-70 family RNA polymerase sigma factor [Phycisphaerae bacterium]NIS50533.1 sigma-70 family RNA polymerase sigma factor [Phycisphaerae bacterium]NIU08268.1 sigma-70 family RNA polymerase sigma factor [Phycisphaerae bacterium]NIU55764.1 sigma-70 family RNA polymerase sigma factor [Phycisphaerae bacterium]NIW92278.1 sigma-70 family RNA polymerase sigma factor [Phycisphaerae bacterium]